MDINKVDILLFENLKEGLSKTEAVLDFPRINVISVGSGSEVLSGVNLYDFAVIILNVQMAEIEGFELAKKIRKRSRNKNTPIIFITDINSDAGELHHEIQLGVVDYVCKPSDLSVLRSIVKVFIDLFSQVRDLKFQNERLVEKARQESALHRAEREVETLKLFQGMADSIPHVVWKTKADGTAEYFNKVWTDLTGLSVEKSADSGWRDAIYLSDLEKIEESWVKAAATKKSFEVECRVRRVDGELRWFWLQANPEKNLENEIVGWLGTGTDINDRKLAQVQLIKAKKTSVLANTAKTDFLANMSHELRTPLNAILGFAELILNPDQPEEERFQSVSTIRRSGHQLLRIIDEILDISKVENGDLEIDNVQVDIIALLSQLRSLLHVQALSKNLRLEFIFKSEIPNQIFTDPVRLRQILLNMIGNAIKFTPRGSVTVEIEWQASGIGDKGHLKFLVRDTGVGINSTQARNLFQPFVQVDNSSTRKFGGTGLGLALSRHLATALNGKINLESSVLGQGSVFTFEMKVLKSESARMSSSLVEKYSEMSRPFADREIKVLAGVKILVVDDAPDNRILISRFLNGAGAHVEEASNGVEGVEKALAGDHEIILMDIQMPELDGYEATSQLRDQGYKRPIIALTAHAFREERDRCLQVGFTDHMTKPVDRRKLIHQIAKLVHESII